MIPLGLIFFLSCFCFCSLIQAKWITLNTGHTRTLAFSSSSLTEQIVLVAGRNYYVIAFPTGSLDPILTVKAPNGAESTNDNWGGTPYAKASFLNVQASDGKYDISVKAGAGTTGNYYLYVLDVDACSSSCSSKDFC